MPKSHLKEIPVVKARTIWATKYWDYNAKYKINI